MNLTFLRCKVRAAAGNKWLWLQKKEVGRASSRTGWKNEEEGLSFSHGQGFVDRKGRRWRPNTKIEWQEGMVGHLSLKASQEPRTLSRDVATKGTRKQMGTSSKEPPGGVRNLPASKQAIPATKNLFLHVCTWRGGMPFCFPEALLTAGGIHNSAL